MERCTRVLISDPEERKGKWRELMPEAKEVFLELGRCFNIVMVRNLQAVGDVRFPVLVGIASQWIVGVGVAWLLGIHFGLGLVGVWMAFALDENLRAVIFVIRWKRGGWRHIKTV